MSASPAERDEYVEYFSGAGAITCRVLYRTEQLAFVQFRTVDWPGYRDFGNYARVALFHAHLRPADPESSGVMNFVRALEREAAIQQQHVSTCRPQTNGQGVNGAAVDVPKRNTDNGQKGPAPEPRLEIKQGNGVKPPPKSAPARQLRVRASGEHGHSLKPVRSIVGLTLADFLCDR
jgi:hypothetical protein